MAKKTIRLTESQFKKCIKRLNEISISGDEALANNNGNMNAATSEVLKNAAKAGTNISNGGTNVAFSADALSKNNIRESFTKGEVMKMRRARLSEGCDVYTKKNLRRKMISESEN